MKKLLSFLLTALMLLLSGCTRLTAGDMSSGEYYNYIYSSDASYVYEDGTEHIDSITSQIESEIDDKVQSGEVTVSEVASIYVTDSSDDGYSSANETGKQTAIIDSSVSSVPAEKIEESDVSTNGEKPLYYTYLNDSQQRIYRIMKTAAEQMTTGFFSLGAVSSDEDRITNITIAYRALSCDNPQIFWLPSSYILSPDGSKLAFSYKNVDYIITGEQKVKAEQALNAVVKQITAQAEKLSSRFEKEIFLHDWICENVVYYNDGSENIYSAYDALVSGKAVCEGYARAMQLLCDNVGIPCTVVYGYGEQNGSQIYHMWNIINPGDGWYNLDVTWDDDEKYDRVRYAYFNVDDTQLSLDHTFFPAAVSGNSYVGSDCFNIYLYSCNSDSYNYFIKKKLIFSDDINAAAKLITDAAANGETSIELLYTNSNKDYARVLNQLNVILYSNNANVQLRSYSYLGNAVVLYW